MEQLKVALCFSGQPRAWKIALDSIQSFIAEFETPPDIFMHVWDFNTTSNHVNNVSEGKLHKHTLIEEEELEELKNAYNPISIQIEDRYVSEAASDLALERISSIRKKDVNPLGSPNYLAPQYYGIKKASQLKLEHEINNNFTYDIVIRMRYDGFISQEDILLFHHSDLVVPKPLNILSNHTTEMSELPFITVGDIFFFSDSLTYDIISQYIDYLPYTYEASAHSPNHAPPHTLFSLYLQSMFLDINPILCNVMIARSDNYFDKLKHYKKEPYDCDVGSKDIKVVI